MIKHRTRKITLKRGTERGRKLVTKGGLDVISFGKD